MTNVMRARRKNLKKLLYTSVQEVVLVASEMEP